MKKRRTNIKIKPRKYSLYSKKKSKKRQVLAAVITIVAAAALCVVGYGIGRPIVDYFRAKQNLTPESSVPWTPTIEITEEETAEPVETTEPTEEAAPAEPEKPQIKDAYYLPESAVLSSEQLNGAIAAAKSSGAQSVVVTLKDNMGYLLYKTSIEGAADSEAVKGALSAKQICDIVTKAGMTPAARISTTKDHVGGTYVGGNFIISGDGGSWHDAAVANGGKRWLSPFSEETSAYIAGITSEIAKAGFKEIILSDTVFPEFHPSDYTTWLYGQPIDDKAARANALWSVISAADSAAQAEGARVFLAMSAENLFAEDRLSTDAEAANAPENLSAVPLLLSYNASGQTYADTRSFIGRMKAAYPAQEYAVLLTRASFSAGALDEVKRAFAEAGIAVFMQ